MGLLPNDIIHNLFWNAITLQPGVLHISRKQLHIPEF